MKKNVPNLVVNLLNKIKSITKPFSFLTKRALIVLLFTLFYNAISAQTGNSVTPIIVEVKSYISSLKAIEENNKVSFSNAKNVEDLVYNLQPSIYFISGNVETYGERPKNLYTNIQSLSTISTASLQKSNIEIVIIKVNDINDLNSIIDLSLFTEFYKLKYIYIVSSPIATAEKIAAMFHNYDEQYSIFYKIEKGE